MVEKLLTNWLSICLYAFLRVRGALDGIFSLLRREAAACGLTDPCPDSPGDLRA